jgi:hypothetical protein
MFTDSGGSSAAGGTWGSTGNNNLSPAVSTTVDDTYTFPSTGTYYLRHTVGSDSNIFVYKIGGDVTTGVNSFYLPLDGNSPIGQDQSGNGNDFRPVNFFSGGSVTLDKATGALPILNTTHGGTHAGVGVFGSKENKTVTVTVASKTGGGNAYFFDSVERDSLATIRGSTITFDTTDSTNNSHPFKLSSTNADSSGGTEYTDGVAYYINGSVTTGADYVTNYAAGAASGFRGIKWTVPHNVSTTYYYCTVHNGMGEGGRLTSTTDETKADPYAWKCVLACPLSGSNIDVSNQINAGSTTKVMTTEGNAYASGNTNQFYGGSFEFDGTGDGITTPDNTDFEFGSGEFTIECWVKQDDTSGFDQFVGKYGGSGDGEYIVGKNGNTPTFYWTDAGGNNFMNATNFRAPSGVAGLLDAWYHMACVRKGDVFTMYINGVCENSTTDATTLVTTSNKLTVGVENDLSSSPFDGYLQDVRIYKGVAKYSGTTIGTQYFFPPSKRPEFIPDTPSGVSGSSKLTKITDGTVTFDGSGDYLDAGAVDTAFGSSSDWTLELFVNVRVLGLSAITDPRTSDSSNHPLIWMGGSPGDKTTGVLYYYAGGADRIVGTTVLKTDKWYHVAVVRSSGTTTLYLDGESEGSFSDSLDYASTTNFRIGQRYTGTAFNYNGMISNLRVVNGTAVYTGPRITPPAAPLTNVTNTKLLCCQSNAQPGTATTSPNMGGINNGTQWSSYLTVSDSFTASGRAAGFDGSTGTYSQPNTNSSFIAWAPSGGITYSTSVEVYTYQSNGVFTTVSDGAQSVSWTTLYQGWKTIASGGGTFTSTKLTSGNPSVSDSRPTFAAVRVDGTILVDPLSPNGDVAATTFNPFNTDINTVRGQETGYATWNPLKMGTSDVSMSEGNLFWRTTSNGPDKCTYSTIGMDSGKWYWENEIVEATATAVGIANVFANQDAGPGTAHNWMYYSATGQVYLDGSASSYGSAYNTNGTIIGVAFDRDNLTLEFYKNGVSQGKLTSISGLTDSETYFAMCGDSGGGSQSQVRGNFGQKPFKFPPPDGFQPLNTANVRPETVISRPDQYVGVTTYSGNSSSSNFVTDLNFNSKPDFVWIKARSGSSSPGSQNHYLVDSVRGANGSVTKKLYSNSPSAENDGQNDANNGVRFVLNGFELTSNNDGTNANNAYVAWAWKAGGDAFTYNKDGGGGSSASDIGVSATTLTLSGASINTTSKFGIYAYTGSGSGGATLNHGLGGTPGLVIYKRRTGSSSWQVYHKSLGGTKYMNLDENTDAYTSDSTRFGGTDPTSTTITLGTHGNGNVTTILYAWCDVPGLQKFGQYEGNAQPTEGNYIHLGFRPALLIIKDVDSTGYWYITDSERNPTNDTTTSYVWANATTAEQNDYTVDLLSDGFDLYATTGNLNATRTYIYMAWAEAPSVDLYGGGANAR